MTIEELIGNIIGTMTRHGWENIKTVNGDQNRTLGVLFNGGPNDLPFPTPAVIALLLFFIALK